jgi:hypothetical protein
MAVATALGTSRASGGPPAGTIECFDIFNRPEPIGVDYAPGVDLSIRKQSPIILPSIGIEGGF